MKYENYMTLEFPSKSANEAFARAAVACFAAQLDPNLEELNDIKTAVSEAVTNCIVHAYRDSIGEILIKCRILPENTYLMEIKVPGAMPVWLARILSELEIRPVSFSKYGVAYKQWLLRVKQPQVLKRAQ